MSSHRGADPRTAAALRFARRAASGPRAPLPRALNEECGVFGLIGNDGPAASRVAMGLHALQHRGQEAAGICTFDGEQFYAERNLGLVIPHFTQAHVLEQLEGQAGIGHTRYSTTGAPNRRNVQPFYADLDIGGVALAHNGNLTNARVLRQRLIQQGRIFHTTSDSELFLKLIAQSRAPQITDRVREALGVVEGAYGLLVLSQDCLIGVRDPVGIRPLVLGRLNGAPVLASETCAFDLIGAEFERDIEPGEMVICSADGTVKSVRIFPAPAHPRPCIFELIYFARPNSFIDGQSVYALRKRLGQRLAMESPVEADLVAPIPDSGIAAAIGYAAQARLDYDMALIRGHYAGRTFIEPTQEMRELGVARKLSANKGVVDGKRITLIDDSLVRGTTSKKITAMLREAGAREVHFRIACPPIVWPDYYGIDTPDRDELMAATHTIDQMRDAIGADSLAFLSLDGIYDALDKGPRGEAPAFTDHCFTGDYPTSLADQDSGADCRPSGTLSYLKERTA
ncbi:amidophosphoribosyltransferase [Parvularcula bermudensis HTCC2503]|uniref:Amidophosphoribosyltransferase n=1 Tax=Parvularcula bermudensis (strain ATCC BAA-594 / HTCC2503 / KCTC 12087) TaxID=314260 RepID=E0TCP5_PARBH|nr:amidophosphoribosyltransferase [Parvularcula bermudensis]ADM08634.1 amidophosphoribosyltransferase [Parvularcula bermudensis HTCC2503]